MAAPLLLGLGSCLRFLAAADARPFLPSAWALACGKHLGLPSFSDPRAQGPRILPSGPNRTHFSLNHLCRFSETNSRALMVFFLLPMQWHGAFDPRPLADLENALQPSFFGI